MDIEAFKGMGKINVILGRNGSGKSRLLRGVDRKHRGKDGLVVKYVTPERGGEWTYDSSVTQNLRGAPDWASNVRHVNRFEQYRQLALAEFTALELGYYRTVEEEHNAGALTRLNFNAILEKINALLDNVKIDRPRGGAAGSEFPVVPKSGGDYGRNFMSSGESEAVALGAEIVAFAHQSRSGSKGDQDDKHLLLIDEPDVHLHPDLQHKLMKLLIDEVQTSPMRVAIATHSTAIVAALTSYPDARVAFMVKNATSVQFRSISKIIKRILPIFGAHPLSNVFNENPILLVEGDDEVRLWQQVVRSSNGSIKLWPCPVGGVGMLPAYEQTVDDIATAIYDTPKAYSLRDGDGKREELQDTSVIVRMRLNCRSSENLMLTEEVLRRHNTKWSSFKQRLNAWLAEPRNANHPKRLAMLRFKINDKYDRRNANLKDIRNILLAELGATAGWEFTVGQTIATENLSSSEPHSLRDYLGEKVLSCVLRG